MLTGHGHVSMTMLQLFVANAYMPDTGVLTVHSWHIHEHDPDVSLKC